MACVRAIVAGLLAMGMAGCGLILAPVAVPEAFSQNGTLALKGTIEDETGEPLDQVLVNIDRTYYLWHAEGNYNEYTKELVAADRNFSIGPMRARELSFTFKKTGYGEATISMDNEGKISAVTVGPVKGRVWPVPPGSKPGEAPPVKIVMAKQDRPLPKLTLTTATVDYTESRKAAVIVMDRPGERGMKSDVVKQLGEEEILPPGMLYAEVVPQALRTAGPERRVDPMDINLPAQMTFRISGDGAGFNVYVPMAGSSALEQMGRAPEEGYMQSLVLMGEELKKMRDPANENVLEKNLFFYFKTGQERGVRFGKGVLNWSSDGGDAVKLTWTLMLQEDGSRNLAGAASK